MFDKRIRSAPDAPELLAESRAALAALPESAPWDAAAIEGAVNAVVSKRGLALGSVVHALRIAVSGKPVGFGLFDILAILGRERTVARIDRALARLTS